MKKLQKCRNCGRSAKAFAVKRDNSYFGTALCTNLDNGCGMVETHATRLKATAVQMAGTGWDAMQLADTSGK